MSLAGPGEPIAIVGIGARLPGAEGPQGYWRLLREGRDATGPVPDGRWERASSGPGAGRPADPGSWGGFLAALEDFDADFFHISAREAERMDPQQRIALEVAAEALEDAGIALSAITGSRAGVYMGVSSFDHATALAGLAQDPEPYDGTGGALSIVANRLSYCLDLRGPSLVVDTACSSSLVAMDLACRALRAGEASLALAGGVNVISSPRLAASFAKAGLMAADGRCKPFDGRADGYVRSEGAGVVVLKPLAAALGDGDRVYATVLGSAVSQDGRTNGLTAPSRSAQEEALGRACQAAGVEPARVGYVEAHGTGTAVGDQIELAALAAVYAEGRPPERSLRVGSTKSNLGHLEAAAGVAGLIKVALCLHHRELVASIHLERPRLDPARGPIAIQERLEPWNGAVEHQLAGVSSFGFGGTNCHLILAQAPTPTAAAAVAAERAGPPQAQLIPLSAGSHELLAARARALQLMAQSHEQTEQDWVAQLGAAAALRSDRRAHAAALVVSTPAELAEAASALAAGERSPSVCGPHSLRGRPPRPVFVFSGQGTQWLGMGAELARGCPAFRAAIRRCNGAITRWLGRSLWQEQSGLQAHGVLELQPALFAIQVALAETLIGWGVEPAAAIGHSAGEIAAAHVAGALSLEDAARIACARGALLQRLEGEGGLVLTELSLQQATTLIEEEPSLSVAASNGPRATVIAGAPQALSRLIEQLGGKGVLARRIAVEFAAHSETVEPLLGALAAELVTIAPETSARPLYSTVTGELLHGTELDGSYWQQNLRRPVLFASAVERAIEHGQRLFLEISPHPALVPSILEIGAGRDCDVAAVGTLKREHDELRSMLSATGELYSRGARVDWRAIYPQGSAHTELPRHGWERRRFSLPAPTRPLAAESARRGTLLGERAGIDGSTAALLWTLALDPDHAPELSEHRVEGTAVIPCAYWLTAAAEAAAGADTETAVLIEDVSFSSLCRAAINRSERPRLSLGPGSRGALRFELSSEHAGEPRRVHSEGQLRAAEPKDAPPLVDLDALARRCTQRLQAQALYDELEASGLAYGERFRGVAELSIGADEALARLQMPALLEPSDSPLHPALLDACLHPLAVIARRAGRFGLALPGGVERVWARLGIAPLSRVLCHAKLTALGEHELRASVTVTDEHGTPVWAATGLAMRLIPTRADGPDAQLYALDWEVAQSAPATQSDGAWLLLADERGVARALAARLGAMGDSCWLCASPEGLSSAARGRPLKGVIDARGLDLGEGPDARSLAQAGTRTLTLTRALLRREHDGLTPRLWLLSPGAQAGTKVTARALAASTQWGLGRVIDHELAELDCSTVDLPRSVEPEDIEALATAIRSGAPHGQIAIRGGRALTPRLRRIAPPVPARSGRFGPDRQYLISGGLGSLAGALAGWLVRNGARRLLLIGRGEPSPEAAGRIERLRGLGTEIELAQLDISDAQGLARLIAAAESERGPIGGVFHAAGVLEDSLIGSLDQQKLGRALAGKALGAWNLHVLTREQPLELFVMFSSLAGLMGSPGQGAYAAANTFLDALALHRHALSLPALSIAWGPWAGAGLAARSAGAERLAAAGMPPLQAHTGLELLGQALELEHPQLVAARFDWDRLAAVVDRPGAPELLRQLLAQRGAKASARSAVRRQILALPSIAQREEMLSRVLLEALAEVLRASTTELDSTRPFQELGLDSLMAIELRNRIEAELECRIPAALLFAHPTVQSLTAGLLGLLEGEAAAKLVASGP